jgi:hypothetical protein
VIGGDATLSAAIVSRDGLFPRRGVEAPTRLPGGLEVLELPKVSGRAFDPTADALCPGSKSSVFRRRRLLGLTSRCADMAVSWCTTGGSELVRLRFSRCSSAGGVGGSCSSQEEIRVVFSVRVEGDMDSDVAIITCGAVGAGGGRDSVLVLLFHKLR